MFELEVVFVEADDKDKKLDSCIQVDTMSLCQSSQLREAPPDQGPDSFPVIRDLKCFPLKFWLS